VSEPPLPDEEPDRKRKDDRIVSLTFSPLHLVIGPIFEMQIEAQVTPHFGVAVLGGVGSLKVENAIGESARFTAYELGGQLVGYPLEDFKSLQLGAEVLWVKVSTDDVDGRQVQDEASGVAFGPFIGYKLITSAGFTFFAQGGFEYLKASEDDVDSEFIPLLNLNIGWSF
jgi:hypothetical protein